MDGCQVSIGKDLLPGLLSGQNGRASARILLTY